MVGVEVDMKGYHRVEVDVKDYQDVCWTRGYHSPHHCSYGKFLGASLEYYHDEDLQ